MTNENDKNGREISQLEDKVLTLMLAAEKQEEDLNKWMAKADELVEDLSAKEKELDDAKRNIKQLTKRTRTAEKNAREWEMLVADEKTKVIRLENRLAGIDKILNGKDEEIQREIEKKKRTEIKIREVEKELKTYRACDHVVAQESRNQLKEVQKELTKTNSDLTGALEREKRAVDHIRNLEMQMHEMKKEIKEKNKKLAKHSPPAMTRDNQANV